MELGDPEADVRKTPQHRMYTSGNVGSRTTTGYTSRRCIFQSTPPAIRYPIRARAYLYIASLPRPECTWYRRIRAASEHKRRIHNNSPVIEDHAVRTRHATLLPRISYENSTQNLTSSWL